MGADVYISIGGNQGPVLATLHRAIRLLEKECATGSIVLSKVYKTVPADGAWGAPFLNMVCGFSTPLSILTLFEKMGAIERVLGKVPKSKQSPRSIDLDLLFYGFHEEGVSLLHQNIFECLGVDLVVPHPQWNKRLFVLLPLENLIQKISIKGDGKEMVYELSEWIQRGLEGGNNSIISVFDLPFKHSIFHRKRSAVSPS